MKTDYSMLNIKNFLLTFTFLLSSLQIISQSVSISGTSIYTLSAVSGRDTIIYSSFSVVVSNTDTSKIHASDFTVAIPTTTGNIGADTTCSINVYYTYTGATLPKGTSAKTISLTSPPTAIVGDYSRTIKVFSGDVWIIPSIGSTNKPIRGSITHTLKSRVPVINPHKK